MFYSLFFVVLLVVLSGTFAGLTLALFSLNLTTLKRKSKLGDVNAEKVYSLRKHGNLLLCTLLLGNATSYTFMPIFLSQVTSGYIAGTIATGLIFIFGEILPQAVFPRFALALGVKFYWFVRIMLFIFYPIAAPIAWVLDKFLGKEPPVLWSKKELEEIIKYHEDKGEGIIDEDEERIILGALRFSELPVSEIMVPEKDVYTLESQAMITDEMLETIKTKGYSKVPVRGQNKKQIIGVLYIKNLIGYQTSKMQTVGDLSTKSNLIEVKRTKKLDDLFNLMAQKKTYISIVIEDNKFVGIATLEDVLKTIVNRNLEDQKM